MANIFTLENVSDFSEKLNIDELYERKRQYDLNQLALYNKLLNRIHVRIKTTARQKTDEQFCWYVVPEIMIGVPKYDQGACIAYLVDKLKENGFAVNYIHPNTLMISWKHFVPSYVRTELKKKTGIVIDENGNKVGESDNKTITNGNQPISLEQMMFKNKESSQSNSAKAQNQKKYTPIASYKPQGNLVYNDDLLNTLGDKFS
jgi:phage antirepressor YoqD-like protein